jgi:hypothetical protein
LPNPARLPPVSPPRSFPSGAADFEGPDVPRRITGAEKLILGIFAGGWKLGGNPPGRPGCCAFACCMPGGGAVPGADMPGGGPGHKSAREYI